MPYRSYQLSQTRRRTSTTVITTSSSSLSVSSASRLFQLSLTQNGLSATLEQTHLLPSRLLAPHARFYVREMRILAYAQLLQSYSSLTLDSLAHAFGVTVDFVDKCVIFRHTLLV